MIRVVSGPPCSGKSTYVDQHATTHDVVVDLDHIANALGYSRPHIDWGEETPHPARVAAMTARASVLKAVLDGRVTGGDVWVIESRLDGRTLAKYREHEVSFVELDPGRDVCHVRADNDARPIATHDQIERWYAAAATTSTDW